MNARWKIFLALLSLNACLLAQPDDLQQRLDDYAKERGSSGKWVLSSSQAEQKLQAPEKPLIIHLCSATGCRELDVKPDVEGTFSEALKDPLLQGQPTGRSVLIMDDDDDSSATEAMVLLRLAGLEAFAVLADKSPPPPPPAPTSAQAEPSPTLPTPRPYTPAPLPSWLFVVVGLLGLGLLAILAWFLYLQPRRRAAPFRKAVDLLKTESPAALVEAEKLLAASVTSGLRKTDLKEAMFLLAYARARLGRPADALPVIAESLAADPSAKEALYLHLWLCVKEKRWNDAATRWKESARLLRGYLRSGDLAGIALLELGRTALNQRQYDQALRYFEDLQAIGVLTEEIPAHLSNLDVVLGISALFEKDVKLAQERFERAQRKATASKSPSVEPRIGLLLCEWQSAEHPNVDSRLEEIVNEMEASATPKAGNANEPELLPPLVLWHAVSLLFVWLTLPEGKGLPEGEKSRLEARLERVRKLMPTRGDGDLMAGLISYYCAPESQSREKPVELLRKSLEHGVSLPEITLLLQAEDKLAELGKRRVDGYYALLKAYLGNPAVPIDLRRELFEHLNKFERFHQFDGLSVAAEDLDAAPTVQDMAVSSQLIEERMRRIFRGQTGQTTEQAEIEALLGRLNQSRKTLEETVRGMGQTEQKLMRVAGETLLPDEPAAISGGDRAAPDQAPERPGSAKAAPSGKERSAR